MNPAYMVLVYRWHLSLNVVATGGESVGYSQLYRGIQGFSSTGGGVGDPEAEGAEA
jgi:hypothetical protein